MRGERTEMRRPAVEMAAAMMPATEMVATTTMMTAAVMATTVMTAAAAATMTSTVSTAASRDGKVRHGQRRCKNNDGNSQSEFRHGASDHCWAASLTARG
jgi:hypothetical protein